jgi:hypothetical protein
MTLRTYRVCRPIHWRGRVYCAAERVTMREDQALPLLESGHLRELHDAPKPLNGTGWDAGLTTR